MTCTVSLGPDGTLSLRTPLGRELLIPVGPHSTTMLWQVLWNSSAERRQLGGRSYSTEFPQQAVIDAWARDIMPQRRKEEEDEALARKTQEVQDKYGFDLNDIEL